MYSVYALSIAAKMYDFEWPLREIQGHWFLKCRKNGEIQLSNDSRRHAEWLDALCLLGLRIHALVRFLLTQLALCV